MAPESQHFAGVHLFSEHLFVTKTGCKLFYVNKAEVVLVSDRSIFQRQYQVSADKE